VSRPAMLKNPTTLFPGQFTRLFGPGWAKFGDWFARDGSTGVNSAPPYKRRWQAEILRQPRTCPCSMLIFVKIKGRFLHRPCPWSPWRHTRCRRLSSGCDGTAGHHCRSAFERSWASRVQILYRFVGPKGELRADGTKLPKPRRNPLAYE
jgi:hypothetical protein